jgi:lipopolysaccharide biosynthesis regulator YciM
MRPWLLFIVLTGCAGSLASTPTSAPSARQLVEIADLLAERGERARAGQYLELAQQSGVPEHELLPRMLKLYVADGQLRLAIDRAEQYLRRHPGDSKLRLCLASLYAAVDDPAAVRELNRVVTDEPANADAHFALAGLTAKAGERDRHYRAYLALAPDGRHAEEARANLLQELP